MPLSRSRDYLSIGEVLAAVRDEYPDISISKIRFLESEGLLTPERTQSGYRKFYEQDVERLRYILSLQRDHFMPLRVIKDRLENGNGAVAPAPAAAAAPAPAAAAAQPVPDMSGAQLTRAELIKAAGLSDQQLAGLEDFGLLAPNEGGVYDEVDLMVAQAARRFMEFGAEPRHLRMFRQFAEREVTFFEQIVTPAALRKDPSAQKVADQSMRELADLARKLHEAMLRTSLRDQL